MEPPREWASAIALWLSSQRAAGRPETTLTTRRCHVERFARCTSALSPAEQDPVELVAWFGQQRWAQDTRRGYRQSIVSFFEWAERAGVATLPARDVLPVVRASRPHPRPVPDRVYRETLMLARPRERLMVRLAAEVGLRRAEVAVLHSSDVVEDLAGWSLTVHGKGSKERVVPLPESLARELLTLPPGWAFPGNDHGHLSARWVGTVVRRLLPPGWSMHKLRHKFASDAYAIDHDPFVVQALLGHDSAETTRRYVVVPNEALRRTVDAVQRRERAA